MSWAALFWIVYGVGSTLFVLYLFRLGKNVGSNRKELIQQEIERIRTEEVKHSDTPVTNATRFVAAEKVSNHTDRMHVQRIFQPDTDHVSVQGMRDGMTCVINLPVGPACAAVHARSDLRPQAAKVR